MSKYFLPVNYQFIQRIELTQRWPGRKVISFFYNDDKTKLTIFYKPIIYLV